MPTPFRLESDLLGELRVPLTSRSGIHTARAASNFRLAGRPIAPALVHAMGVVKLACALTNRRLGAWDGDEVKADAIERACREMADGLLDSDVVVDRLQGGAGTSTNMNVNEVLANRALELLGEPCGRYARVSPTGDLNLHQSTNDVFPTAVRVAAIRGIRGLDRSLVALQEAFQDKEKAFSHIVKVGRTQMQDAVLTTLGREMGAYAEAFNRDRWRVYKCEERLRVVNLGGTAIGTGLSAPRAYIFRVVDCLREETGLGLARAENLVEATQNADVFAEVSGILKTCATNLLKVANDLRLMSSGPRAGLGEISLPPRQAGSSIMPGKVNPVIPEAAMQAAMMVVGHDTAICHAVAAGSLELNPFLPLIAACLLDSIDLLTRGCQALRDSCVVGIEAREEQCRAQVDGATATATALVSALGYDRACEVAARAEAQGTTVRAVAVGEGYLDESTYQQLICPEAVCALGSPAAPHKGTRP